MTRVIAPLRGDARRASTSCMVGGLATAVQDLKTVVTKTGFDCGDASYFLELLCVNDYDDRNKPLTENRPSTAGVGKRPSVIETGGAGGTVQEDALAEANAKAILKKQLAPSPASAHDEFREMFAGDTRTTPSFRWV